MEYRSIYYRETSGEFSTYRLEYKVNFIMGEGGISYANKVGGHTTRGVKLDETVLAHMKLLLNQGKPEQYRDRKNLSRKTGLMMDGNNWEFVVHYVDGKPELQIDNSTEDVLDVNHIIEVPAFINEMRKYAINQLTLDDF